MPTTWWCVASTYGDARAVGAAAVDAGLAVVVEKPLAPLVAPARALVERAAAAGVHARRCSTTVAGTPSTSRCSGSSPRARWVRCCASSRASSGGDRNAAPRRVARRALAPTTGEGCCSTSGVHLVDQARTLARPRVPCLRRGRGARRGGSDDDVFVALHHRSGARSHLWASAVAAAPGPRLRVLGSAGGLCGRAPRRPGGGVAGRSSSRRAGVRSRASRALGAARPWRRRGAGAERTGMLVRVLLRAWSARCATGQPPPVDPEPTRW